MESWEIKIFKRYDKKGMKNNSLATHKKRTFFCIELEISVSTKKNRKLALFKKKKLQKKKKKENKKERKRLLDQFHAGGWKKSLSVVKSA